MIDRPCIKSTRNGNEVRPQCSRMTRQLFSDYIVYPFNIMRGPRVVLLLPALWLHLVLAHHGEGRWVPNTWDHEAAPKPVPCSWVCGPENIYHCGCVYSTPGHHRLKHINNSGSS